tara:strand:- start:609 stop:1157 length:549 start_codon:yes stop_codon:yes gene_type:complete
MANIPFVSEEFQRAFRNQFPSQTSTGRDLHVSDIVIPVVDFTPTTSGASLPETLRTCRNGSTVEVDTTSAKAISTDVTAGFWRVCLFFSSVYSSGALGAECSIQLLDGAGTAVAVLSRITQAGSKVPNFIQKDEFYAYAPADHTLASTLFLGNSDSRQMTITYTPIADINGNLTQPFGYDPQ